MHRSRGLLFNDQYSENSTIERPNVITVQHYLSVVDIRGCSTGWAAVWLRLGCDRRREAVLRKIFSPHRAFATGMGDELRSGWVSVGRSCFRRTE